MRGLHVSYITRSHDLKSYVAPYFYLPDPGNAMGPLMLLLPLHNANDSTNGITCPKSHVASPFDHLSLTNGMVPMMTLLTTCDTDTSTNGIT